MVTDLRTKGIVGRILAHYIFPFLSLAFIFLIKDSGYTRYPRSPCHLLKQPQNRETIDISLCNGPSWRPLVSFLKEKI